MKNTNYIINLLLKDNGLSAKIKKLQGNFDALDGSVNAINQTISTVTANVSSGLRQVDGAVSKTARNIEKDISVANFVAIADAARNVADAFNTLSSSGSGFEQSMANLSAATGITGNDLDELSRIALESGQATGIGATQAANAFTQLASQVKVSKVGLEGLKTLQQETITLSKAGGIGMSEAATAMTDTINQFGLGAEDANRVINLLAAGSRNGTAGITDLAASLKVTGAAAVASGVSVEQAAGALEVLSRNNLKGAEAGTALSGILTAMQASLGIDLSQTGLSAALESLIPLLGNTSELTRIFGEANAGTVEYLIGNASAVAQMTTALTDTNVAQEQAAIRTGTYAEQMLQMQAGIDNAKIKLFELTGGFSVYLGVVTENLVAVAQLVPFFGAMGSGLSMLSKSNLEAAANTTVSTLATVKSTAANVAHAVQQKVAAAATTTMAVAQKALNAVMAANPIALVVLAITTLVSGLIAAYSYFDGFRLIVDSAWTGIKQLAAAIWGSLVGAFEKVSSVIAPVWSKLKALLGIQEEVTQSTEKLTEAKKGEAAAAALLSSQTEGLTEQSRIIEEQNRLWKENQAAKEKSLGIVTATPPPLTPLEAPANRGIDLESAGAANSKAGMIGNMEVADTSSLKTATSDLDKMLGSVDKYNKSIWGSNSIIGQWANNASSEVNRMSLIFGEFGAMLKSETLSPVQQVSGGLQAMGAMMGTMGSMVDGAAGSWLSWGANVLGTIANALPQLLELFGVQCAVAAAGAATSVASIPVVGWIMAGVAVASVVAALASIPKPKAFANGGLVYGNTFAQVGEYPGAANNPEVIAPLSKLRQLIQPAGSEAGVYEFRLRGRDFVAVAARYDNLNNRTR